MSAPAEVPEPRFEANLGEGAVGGQMADAPSLPIGPFVAPRYAGWGGGG